jgi:hypothetical protein
MKTYYFDACASVMESIALNCFPRRASHKCLPKDWWFPEGLFTSSLEDFCGDQFLLGCHWWQMRNEPANVGCEFRLSLGACVHASGMVARMLDRLNIWNFVAKATLTITLGANTHEP